MNASLVNPIQEISTHHKSKPDSKLLIISNLLDEFHRKDIKYCHWKSNEHLGASMAGDTDLDILFDHSQKGEITLLLAHHGFCQFTSAKQKQYKDIEDFLGLDLQTGKVVHVHAHFKLTMGEMYLKGYQLDLEKKILSTRIYDKLFGIYCTSPEYELILLFFREALKIRNRDILMMYLFNRIHYTGNIMSEYIWLKERTNDEQVSLLVTNMCKEHLRINAILSGKFNRKELLKLAELLKKEFSESRIYSPAYAFIMRHYREVSVKISKNLYRVINSPIVSQRINPRGGIIVAVIGADGSGKSTAIENLQQNFKQKLDVYRIYFGRGDGKQSWVRKVLNSVKSIFKPKIIKIKPSMARKNRKEENNGTMRNIYRCCVAMLVAYEKRINLWRMINAKKKGMLVICDRYPQNQIMGFNDGPLLHDLSTSDNPVFRAISKLESRVYSFANKYPPDLLFKLIADARIVEARKPGEISVEKLEAKIEGIRKLNFNISCKVITIDASQPLEKVLHTLKCITWDNYK